MTLKTCFLDLENTYVYMYMSNYKSQIGQDEYVTKYIFNMKRNGYFVDIGAADGIRFSNSYYMEKELEWKGICIEANPLSTDALKANRACIVVCAPVYSVDDREVEFSVVSDGLFSGISNHLGNIGNYTVDKTVKLKTKTLTTILNEAHAPKYIDYMSLDVEGSELEVLKGMDFSQYIVGYIGVEHNFQEPARSNIRTFLQSKGYLYARWNKFDDEFMHVSLAGIYAWSNSNTMMTPKLR